MLAYSILPSHRPVVLDELWKGVGITIDDEQWEHRPKTQDQTSQPDKRKKKKRIGENKIIRKLPAGEGEGEGQPQRTQTAKH